MSIRKCLIHWWKARGKIARLTRDAEAASNQLGKAYDEAKEKNLKGVAVQEYTAEAWSEYTWANDALDDALSQQLVQRARRLRVPVPQRSKDSRDWEESSLYVWRLTQDAGYQLRKAIAEEVEMRQRPWLNWAATVVSVLSLLVAILALRGGAR